MNWEAIAAVGQLLGSIAVLATLVYLAIQTRHARAETRRAVNDSHQGNLVRLCLTRATDTRRLGARAKASLALTDGQAMPEFVSTLVGRGLAPDEAWALFWEETAWFNHRTQMIESIDDLATAARSQFDSAIRRDYVQSGISRLYWDGVRKSPVANAQTLRHIEDLLSRSDGALPRGRA